jgi:hypothetical protein
MRIVSVRIYLIRFLQIQAKVRMPETTFVKILNIILITTIAGDPSQS